jgi:hypothetical protein
MSRGAKGRGRAMTGRRELVTSIAALGVAVCVGCQNPTTPGSLESANGAANEAEAESGANPTGAARNDGSTDGNADDRKDAGGTDTGTTSTLSEKCAAACKAQVSLSCFNSVPSCQSECVAAESATENPSVSCVSEYDALAACEATLTQWTCSQTSGNPIPAAGKCTASVCGWACCVGSDIADPDIWTECMSSCPS